MQTLLAAEVGEKYIPEWSNKSEEINPKVLAIIEVCLPGSKVSQSVENSRELHFMRSAACNTGISPTTHNITAVSSSYTTNQKNKCP